MRCRVVLLLAAALPAAVLAAPRPGPAVHPAPTIPAFYDADARLAKRVTMRMAKSPLAKIAAALQRQTGVRLEAMGEVADEPAILFAFDRPLKDVMVHLALLFDYRWDRLATDAPGGWRYELRQDRDAKAREQALRDADLAASTRYLDNQIRLCSRLAGEPPEAVRREFDAFYPETRRTLDRFVPLTGDERLATFESTEYQRALQAERDARLYQLMQFPIPRALAKFAAGLTPADWSALEIGDILRFRTQPDRSGDLPLPPEIARALEAARPVLAPPIGLDPAAFDAASLQKEEQRLGDAWTHASGYTVSVRMEPIIATEPWDDRVPPGLVVQAEPEGVVGGAPSYPFNDLGLGEEPLQRDAPPIQASHPDYVPPGWVSDPVLGAKRQLKLEAPPDPWLRRTDSSGGPGLRVCDLLPQIAQTYGINLVADAYRYETYEGYSYRWLPNGEECPLYRALNRIALPTSRWTKEGDVFHARHHAWYYDRLAEIPDRLGQRYEAQLRRHPQLSLQDAAALALALNDAQLRQLPDVLAERGVWLEGPFRWQIADQGRLGRREALRGFGSLSRSQQSALLAGRSISCADLPPAALRWLRLALNVRKRAAEKPLFSVLTPEVSLSLATQPIERVIRQQHSGFWLSYYLAGTTDFPDINGKSAQGGVVDAVDDVPLAPGFIAPEPGATSQALFDLRWSDGTQVTWGVILPRADLRATTAAVTG
jgi:hypothetical protein